MKLLIVKLSSLGDILQALPAVHGLRTGLDARIDWVVQKEYVDLVSHFSDVDRVIGFPRRGIAGGIGPFLHELRRESYDTAVDLQGLLKSAFVARAARAARRIGPSFHREGSRLFYHAVAGPRDRQRHAVDQIMDILDHFELPRGEAAFPIEITVPALSGHRPFLAICPISRWKSKNWPLAHFIAVGQAFRKKQNGRIFVVGSPADTEACDTVARGIGADTENLAGRTSLTELTGVLAAMDLVLTNDSGPMHLAAAVGTRTVALFGPTDPQRTGPYGPGHTVLQAEEPCPPCFARTCKRKPTCMDNISVDRVLAALQTALGNTGCVNLT